MHVTSLIFCKKLQWHKDLKWTSMFFWKKLCLGIFGSKAPQIGLKMRPFKFYKKSFHGDFLIFCMRLQQHKGLKWTQMGFFLWKVLYQDFWAKRGSKWVLGFLGQNEGFKFYGKWKPNMFLIFCRKLRECKDLKLL